VQDLISKIRNNKDVAYNQIFNIISYFVTIIISLLTLKIITTKIPPDDYGILVYVLAVMSISTITTITGFNKTIGGYVAKGFHGTVKQTLKISLKTGLLGVVILAGFSYYYSLDITKEIEFILFFIAALFFIPYTVFARYSSILAGLEKFKQLMYLNILLKISVFLVLFFVLVVIDRGILFYWGGQIIITSILLYIFYRFSVRQLNNDRVDNGFLKHSCIISLVGVSAQVIAPGIQLIINDTFGMTTLAVYAVANRIPTQLMAIVKPLLHPVSIRLAKKSSIDYYNALLKCLPLTLLMGGGLYLVMFLVVDNFGYLVIGENYKDAIYYTKFLGLIMVLTPTYSLLNSCLVFEKQNRLYAISFYIHQVILVVGYLMFTYRYGIISIAIVNFIALFVQVIIMSYVLNKKRIQLIS
jgi:O-antigen/teichoic acid export membrane protein